MLLATQCPHCFTSFRVANDQLKLHAGLVRCGACQQTFNGIEYLLAPGAKPARPPAVAADTTSVQTTDAALEATAPIQIIIPEIAPEVAHDAEPEVLTSSDTAENTYAQSATASPGQDIHQIESIHTSSSSALEFDLGDNTPFASFVEAEITVAPEFAPEAESDITANVQVDLPTQNPLVNEADNDDGTAPKFQLEQTEQEQGLNDEPDTEAHIKEENSEENADAEKPAFVIQAEKKQRRSRWVRVLMIISSTLLFLTLLAQGTYTLRNHIAAWFPQTKPVLQETCKFLRCRIELPTQIEVISIESNELQALSNDKNIFSLAIQLQNKSGTLQTWPMLELILNDARDKPVLRRVFTPADYLANKNDLVKGFASNTEQTIKLYFELSGPKAAGYHVGVFYP